MKPILTFLTALLLPAPLPRLNAADTVSHRLLVTDYGGNRVCMAHNPADPQQGEVLR